MENELTHWGIRGMKWGVRRYQNKDGTLTPAGQKRYNKEMSKLKAEEKVLKNRQRTQSKFDKLDQKRKEVEALKSGKPLPKKTKKPSQSSVKDLSDDELRSMVNRMLLEQQYSKLKPEQVSTGKKFVDKVMKDVIAPAATDVGKEVVKNALKKGVNSLSESSKNEKK